MFFYEKDELNIPKRYRRMSLEKLDRGTKFIEGFALFLSKVIPSSKKNMKENGKIKFYL